MPAVHAPVLKDRQGRKALRTLRLADAPALFRLVDGERLRLRRWLDWVDRTRSVKDSREVIRGAQKDRHGGTRVVYALQVDGVLAGTLELEQISAFRRSAEIGYWIGEAYEGHGHMMAACRLLMRHAFKALKLNRLTLYCRSGNRRSAALARRLGFKLEGRYRQFSWPHGRPSDRLVFGLLASEYRS